MGMDIQAPQPKSERLSPPVPFPDSETEGKKTAPTRERSGLFWTLRSRWKTTAVLAMLVLASLALLYVLDPWHKWGFGSGTSYRDQWGRALSALEDRDFGLAQSHLANCLAAAPLNAEAHFLMARTCRRADDFSGWFDHLQTADLLGWPQDQVVLEILLKEAQVGNTWKVEQQLQSYLTAGHPEEVLIVEALVRGYLDNDLPKKAFHLTEEWINNYPDDWQARFYHGRALQLGARFKEAIADYKKVLLLKPRQPEGQLWLAHTLRAYTQFDQAIEYYQAYLESRPDDPDALHGLAQCQFTQGDSEGARATLDELLNSHPYHAGGLYLRAQLEQAEGPEKALPWLRRAVAIVPYEPNRLHNLVLALRALHQDKEADHFQEQEKISRQKDSELIELERRLIQETDKVNEVEVRYQVAVLHMELGHKEEETAHWIQTVLYLNPDHRPTLQLLADCLERQGNSRRAAYYRERAEGKRPAMPSAAVGSR
jgi:tetratricopeptide (TPR) repeat protein